MVWDTDIHGSLFAKSHFCLGSVCGVQWLGTGVAEPMAVQLLETLALLQLRPYGPRARRP